MELGAHACIHLSSFFVSERDAPFHRQDGSMHLIAGTYTNAPHPDKDKIQEMTQVETFSKSVFSSQAFLELSTTALTARSVHAEHSPVRERATAI